MDISASKLGRVYDSESSPTCVVTRVWDEGECHQGGATRVVTRVGMRVV